MTLNAPLLAHCNENPTYVFLFWELRGLSPNFHIYVSVSDLYIPRIGPHISSSRKGRPIMGIYNSLTDTWMWKLGLRPRYSFPGSICFKFCLCSAVFTNTVSAHPCISAHHLISCASQNLYNASFLWIEFCTLSIILRGFYSFLCISQFLYFLSIHIWLGWI